MRDAVFLTGASGFVGANLARRLIRDGTETHALVRDPARAWRLRDLSDHFHIHQGDLRDADRLRTLVGDIRPRVIFHLAAEGGYERVRNSREAFEINLLGTIGLMDACMAEAPAVFVQAGTSSEYGPSTLPMREDAPLHPASGYAIAKAAATWHGQLLARERGVPVITLRVFSAYGPWEAPERFIARLMLRLLDDDLPPLVAPDTARDFIHVDDVVEAFLLASARPDLAGEVFNVGTGQQRTIREVVETALSLSGVRRQPQYESMPGRCWDTSQWVADTARAQSILRFRAARDLRQGLADTWAWFRGHRALYERLEAARS